MGTAILTFLSKIKLSHLLIIAIIGLVLALNYYRNQAISEKHSKEIALNNFNNELKLDSLEVAHYKVQSTKAFQQIINEKEDLKKLYNQENIKTSRLQKLIYQQNNYQNNSPKTINVSKIVDSILKNKQATQTWQDKDSCSNIEGILTYKNGELLNTITNKEFNNSTLTSFYKGRRKPVNWLFNLRLGKRQDTIVTTGKCTQPKIQIIERVK